jgi:hypothetical protein
MYHLLIDFIFQIKFLLPKPVLGLREIKPARWASLVQADWAAAEPLSTHQAKAQVIFINLFSI